MLQSERFVLNQTKHSYGRNEMVTELCRFVVFFFFLKDDI